MRSELRIADLKQRVPTRSKLMNVKVPTKIAEAIDRISKELGVPKTDVMVALLNEGLRVAPKTRDGHRRRS